MYIPLLGIDWIGALLWAGFMLCFTFVCVYGDFYDWWDAPEICEASLLGLACLAVNLWRASFLRHPYISFRALTNRNVVRATGVYLVFFTLLATEHVFEHSYAAAILGFDEPNLIDLNWYVLCGILAGCGFTYVTFALRKWRYKTMTAIGFALAVIYLGWFYFMIDYGVEKESLFLPLFFRGAASVIISIVFLTSILQSGLTFQVFPQALTVNGFTGAVMGAVFGPALVGEFLRHAVARNFSLLSSAFTSPRFLCCRFRICSSLFLPASRRALRHDAASGPCGVDERDLRLPAHRRVDFADSNSRQLRPPPPLRLFPKVEDRPPRPPSPRRRQPALHPEDADDG